MRMFGQAGPQPSSTIRIEARAGSKTRIGVDLRLARLRPAIRIVPRPGKRSKILRRDPEIRHRRHAHRPRCGARDGRAEKQRRRRSAMSSINAKSLKVATIQEAHDLLVAEYASDTDASAADETPEQRAETGLTMALTELNYQRVANLPQILQSYRAKLKRGEARATAVTAAAPALRLAEHILGRAIAVPSAQTEAGGGAKAADKTSMSGTPAASDPDAGRSDRDFSIKAGAEAIIDPILSSATDANITSIRTILEALEVIENKRAEIARAAGACRAVIAAYATNDANVDESGLFDPGRHTPCGIPSTVARNEMLPAIDNLLHNNIEPPTGFQALLDAIAEGEAAISAEMKDFAALKREMRAARPRTAVRTVEARPAGQIESLAEIAEIDQGLEVLEDLAADLFPRCYGINPDILRFEVPRFDFGTVHPDVPAVDPTYRFYTGVLVEALHALAENEIIWLYGDSGCGKSEFWAQIAARLNMPFTRVNLDGHLTRSDLVGGMKLVSNGHGGTETRFVEGAVPRAMSRPGLLLLDEFDCGDPEIMPILQPVLEGKPLVLLEDGGRIVHPHPMFRIAITGNSKGLGSDNQMYLNVFEQSSATRDRISAFVEMPYMPANIEEEVVLERAPHADPDFVRKLIQLAGKVRDGFRAGEIHTLFSTRAVQFCVSRHTRLAPLYPDPDQAVRDILNSVIINRLDPGSTQVVKGLIDNIF